MKNYLDIKTMGKASTMVKEYVLMFVGIALYTFAWMACIIPANATAGGATGLARLLSRAFEMGFGWDIQIGTIALVINVLLLLTAGFLVGWKFGIKTIFCVVMVSVMMNFYEAYLPLLQEWLIVKEIIPAGSESLFGNVDALLLVVMGGLICGSGIFLCFRNGGSTGGVDILAVIINKYRPVNYGRIVMVFDSIVICSALLVGMKLDAVIYGFIITAVFSFTTDGLLQGTQQSTQLLIMSRKYKEVAEAITHDAHRGVTMLDGMGWYTKESTQVVMVLCRKREMTDILKLIKSIDPAAFVSVASVTGVYGQGFGMIGGSALASN